MKRFLAKKGYGKTICVLFTAFIMVFMFCIVIHPFLSYHHPVDSEILIVEGWLGTPFMPLAVEEFYRGHYRQIVTVGGPMPISLQTDDYSNYAERGAFRLKALGIDSKLITPVPATHVKRHKTYAYAQAFRDWIAHSNHNVNAVNVFSAGVHSRKSYLIFQKVLGNDIKRQVAACLRACLSEDARSQATHRQATKWSYRSGELTKNSSPNETPRGVSHCGKKLLQCNSIKVGIISAPPQRYDPRYWWFSRRGIWLVLKNTIAYFEAFWITDGLLHSY